MVTSLKTVLYTAIIRTTGGRDGTSRSDDGRLDVKLLTPRTSGSGTNPEQLSAAGWSASLIAAMKIEAGKRKVPLPPDLAVDAEVGTTSGAYGLAVRFNLGLPGMERKSGQSLVEAAQQICPYVRATRGNIKIAIDHADIQHVDDCAG